MQIGLLRRREVITLVGSAAACGERAAADSEESQFSGMINLPPTILALVDVRAEIGRCSDL
jgi:hypothetical protein